jgi:hypothetical protein
MLVKLRGVTLELVSAVARMRPMVRHLVRANRRAPGMPGSDIGIMLSLHQSRPNPRRYAANLQVDIGALLHLHGWAPGKACSWERELGASLELLVIDNNVELVMPSDIRWSDRTVIRHDGVNACTGGRSCAILHAPWPGEHIRQYTRGPKHTTTSVEQTPNWALLSHGYPSRDQLYPRLPVSKWRAVCAAAKLRRLITLHIVTSAVPTERVMTRRGSHREAHASAKRIRKGNKQSCRQEQKAESIPPAKIAVV